MKKLRIGFIGNFQVPYTTENDRKWSFEKLGHEVVTFQENQVDYNRLMHYADAHDIDLFLYSHTHGWEISGLKNFFVACKARRIPTVSVHLDRWAGLARESDIGKEATWFTEYQFMADFSPEAQELYKKYSLNAYFLKAGVVERDCYMATPDPVRFPHEIIFVGSRGYHPEYPFRPALIDFLHKEYGSRFGHYGNDGLGVMRGHDLNVLYATAKIAIGDSCFGGRPNYVSDRYYETRGRGGFLIHPYVEIESDVETTGVVMYGHSTNDDDTKLTALKSIISYYLNSPVEREAIRSRGHEWVKNHETYTHRAQEMLKIIFKE